MALKSAQEISGVTSDQRGMKVVCLSILLEGGVTISNNSTKRRQNGFKIGTRDKFATLEVGNFISNGIVIYAFFLRSAIFPYNSLYTQAVAYTTYFELGEPVIFVDGLFSYIRH